MLRRRRTRRSSGRRQGDPRGVEMLEQRLRVAARGPELVAQARPGSPAPSARSIISTHAGATASSASGCAYIERPTRTARPAARRAGSSAAAAPSSASLGGSWPASRRRSLERERGRLSGTGRGRRRRGSGLGGGGARRPRPATGAAAPSRSARVRDHRGARARAGARTRVEHDAAAERVGRRDRCARRSGRRARGEQRPLEPQLPEVARRARTSRAGASRVPWWTWTRVPCAGRATVELERGVEQVRRRERRAPGGGEHVAAPTSSRRDAGEVDRHALARRGALDGSSWTCTPRTRARAAARQEPSTRVAAPRSRPTTASRSRPCRRRGS